MTEEGLKMDKLAVMKIDSAAVLQEADITEEYIRLPEHNDEYKYAIYLNDALWASKDGKEFVLALEARTRRKKIPGSLVQFV